MKEFYSNTDQSIDFNLLVSREVLLNESSLITESGKLLKHFLSNKLLSSLVFYFISLHKSDCNMNFNINENDTGISLKNDILKVFYIISKLNVSADNLSHMKCSISNDNITTIFYNNKDIEDYELKDPYKENPFFIKDNHTDFNESIAILLDKESMGCSERMTSTYGLLNKYLINDYHLGLLCLYFIRNSIKADSNNSSYLFSDFEDSVKNKSQNNVCDFSSYLLNIKPFDLCLLHHIIREPFNLFNTLNTLNDNASISINHGSFNLNYL